MKEIIPVQLPSPIFPKTWEYNESVNKIKGFFYQWKTLTEEILNELWIARELLSSSGQRTDLGTKVPRFKNWTTYCQDIGHSRRVVNRWLAWTFRSAIEEEKQVPAFPSGKFDIILADPPWQYSIINVESRATERHYPTLSYEQIRDYTDKTGRKITDLFSQNVILFLWVTAPKANEGFQLLKDWGFEYKTCFVWVKDKIGLGWWNRNQHELLLVATKGNVKIPDESDRVSSVINAPRVEHSKKPNIVYEIIQKYYPEQKYLELFARQKYNEKWEVWGNEYLG